MPRITVHPSHGDGARHERTLSEHLVAANLDSDHYAAQLLERLRWATADAEALESQAARDTEGDHRSGAGHAELLSRQVAAR